MKNKSPPPSGEGKSVLSGRYELGRVLGHGTFAKVHLARDLISGRHVAIKIIPKELVLRAGMMEQLTREISAMRIVRHPNIVELHEVMATKTKIYLALELVRGGELFTRVANFGKLTERAARRYFRQLVSAVDFCHSRGVFHRDLKPENLLVDEEGGLKVADFGLSALADVGGVLRTACGTPAYAAPEVSGRKGYDGATADAWSCGVVLFVLLAGFLPFQDDNIIAMYKKIQRGDFRCPPWFSPDARRVIVRLLDPNPTTRISLAKLVDMPWLKKSPPPLPPMPLPPILPSSPENMNAFELISLSEGLDLSPMFEAAAPEIFAVVRFATREPLAAVVGRIEGATIRAGGEFRVAAKAATKAEKVGRRLAVAVEVFAVAPMVLVVEVRRDNGDALEYRRFCTDQLRPAIEDIVLARSDGHVAAIC